MKNYIKNNYKKLIKLGIFVLIVVAISISCYFIFKALGITDIEQLQKTISGCGVYGWLVFYLLQVIFTVVLCFAPGGSMTFITLGVILFGANYKTFLLCFLGVITSSLLMDLLGRFGGSKVIIKLVGEDDYKKALSLIQEKGAVYVPIMYLLPLFPDDAICCVVGMTKMKLWLHLIYIVLCRGIGVATIVFGVSLIPKEVADFTSTNLWDYISVATILLFWVFVMLYVARKLDKWLSKKLVKNNVVKHKRVRSVKGK